MNQPPSAPVNVAIAALLEHRGDGWRLLITRRPHDTVYAGFWELPGGKLEPGETPQAAARREIREELGLAVDVENPLPVVEHRYDHAHVRLHPFVCARPREGGDPVAGEPRNLGVAEHRWITREELGGYTFPEANAPIMEEIARVMAEREAASAAGGMAADERG